jgi:hypothetical protein
MARGEPDAGELARPVRRCGLGKRTDREVGTAPQPDPYHVVWVTQGGTTDLANLVLVCSRHHHVLHQPGWQAKLRPDATFEVTDPDGVVRATSPPRAQIPW